jgi:hypothetical protein
VNEPEAKTRWQRAKPPGVVVGLPGYLVGGEWVGVSGVGSTQRVVAGIAERFYPCRDSQDAH